MGIEGDSLWLDVAIITDGLPATHLLDQPANPVSANVLSAKTVDPVRAVFNMEGISNQASRQYQADSAL
jgi:hypothetical protein